MTFQSCHKTTNTSPNDEYTDTSCGIDVNAIFGVNCVVGLDPVIEW